MKSIYVLLIGFQVLSFSDAYTFSCPAQAQWELRAKSACVPPRNYTCLYDVTFRVNVYRDKCSRPRILAPGYKYVFQPNLNRATCSLIRYQPFIFDTIGRSDCTFLKSFCNSEGQMTYKNGTTRLDRTCMCNINEGYTFVTETINHCSCNPSNEDCSCYIGLNPNNRTIGSKDLKCYEDINLTDSRPQVDAFNESKIMKTFNDYKYNLVLPTNEYRTTAAVYICVLASAYLLIVVGLYILQRITRQRIVLPEAINRLPERDRIRYHDLMQSSKTEKRHFVRVMIVGKESAGKTCLLRRLLKESIDDVTSTDGVDIVVRRSKINIDDGKWTIDKEIYDDKVDRFRRAKTLSERTNIETVDGYQSDKKYIDVSDKENMENEHSKKKDAANNAIIQNLEYNSTASSSKFRTNAQIGTTMNENATSGGYTANRDRLSTTVDTNQDLEENENDPLSLVMPANLMSHLFSNSTTNSSSNRYALCELWDFAGQKEFYATHQAFLTSSAVYLVVADMTDDICKQGINQCFADFQNVGEYVDFWFNSIHCHRTADVTVNDHFDPPILLVFTGTDKYDQANIKDRKLMLDKQLDDVLGQQSKYHHLRGKFYLSNTKDSDDEFEKLRFSIYESARKMDNWGKLFPLKWILYEYLIEINKDNGKNFITYTDMACMAKHHEINICQESELLLFLRFQHNMGNIIFFETIPDLIILNPQWLADAFRCLVSNRVDNRLHHLDDWTLLQRHGKISESFINKLFESKTGSQFLGHKVNLHKILEKLDILVKIEGSDSYIMPSKMPSTTFETACTSVGIENCKRTSWLCLKFEFLPPSLFNHLSAWFIRKYKPCKLDRNSSALALYRGICIFDIDSSGSGCEKILVTMSTDTIALQILSFSSQQKELGITCAEVYNEVKEIAKEIKGRYQFKLSSNLHFKCSTGPFHKDTFLYQDLKKEQEYYCPYHMRAHISEELYLPWMKHEAVRQLSGVNLKNKTIDVADTHTNIIAGNKDCLENQNVEWKEEEKCSITMMSKRSFNDIEEHAKAAMVVIDIFPHIMREMIVNIWSPKQILMLIHNAPDNRLMRHLTPSEKRMISEMDMHGYNSLDLSCIYKVMRGLQLLMPPKQGWGEKPKPEDQSEGDDVERMRTLSNDIIHRSRGGLSESETKHFFQQSIEIAKRMDTRLGSPMNGFESKIEHVRSPIFQREM